MMPLNNQQKQLLFDYCLGLTSGQEAAEAEALISSNAQAADIHAKLKSALSPLNSLADEACPDDLAERMILRLRKANVGDSGHSRLEELLAEEQARRGTIKIGFWRNFGDIVTVAAVIMLVSAVLVPSLGHARQQYWQRRCQVQLGNIFEGLSNYTSDHDGRLPAVATEAGDPWWKVGYQGSENHSNTRPVWLLVRNGYVKPENFVCSGIRQAKRVRFDTLQVQNYNDFPGRAYVSFSFRICCRSAGSARLGGRNVLMADINPLAQRFPSDYSEPVKLRLSEEILNFNSANHNRRGQNVMFCDGSIKFAKTRFAADSDDDIFALQGMQCGSEVNGCEVPSCETDTFLAP